MLCNKHNTTPNTVCRELGLSSATATHWRQGAIPRDTTLKKIADYFGITPEDLLRDPAEKVAAPAEPAPTSPLSAEFYDLVDQLTLKELREIQAIMEDKIKNRK
jgi:transcriptional regulator with XRE-family HTH domain